MQSVYFSRFTSLPMLALFPIVDWKSEKNCDLFCGPVLQCLQNLE